MDKSKRNKRLEEKLKRALRDFIDNVELRQDENGTRMWYDPKIDMYFKDADWWSFEKYGFSIVEMLSSIDDELDEDEDEDEE